MAGSTATFAPIRTIVAHAVGGGWGQDEAFEDSELVAVIRGADFPDVVIGKSDNLPVRWEERKKVPSRRLQPGDIILEISGGTAERPTGRTVYVGEGLLAGLEVDVIPASFCRLIRIDRERADPRYVYYWLQAMYADGRTWSYQHRSTGIANFQFNYFLDTEQIWLPSLDKQRRIAHILGALDDKIELNRRMNETLEEMARALFRSWFVDFDPVRAKAEGRDPGLPPHLADLFPDRLVDSELGEIPEGWRQGLLSELVVDFRNGVSPLLTPEEAFEHFSIPAFDDGRQPRIERGASIKSLKLRVSEGAILLSKLNPEIQRVWWTDIQMQDRAVASTEFMVLQPKSGYGRAFIYCLATSSLFRRQIESLVTGTSKSHQRAQREAIFSIATAIPPAPLVSAFEVEAGPGLEKISTNRRAMGVLMAVRDALLPQLISGQLGSRAADREEVPPTS